MERSAMREGFAKGPKGLERDRWDKWDRWDRWDKWEFPIKRSVTHSSHQAKRYPF